MRELQSRLAAARLALLSAEAAIDSEELRLRLELQAVARARLGKYVDPMVRADFDWRGRPRVRETQPDGRPRA